VCIYDDKGKFLAVQKLEEVKIGSFIKSRDETTQKDVFVKIIDKHDHGVLELFEIELETGEKIRCTMDHKFRTTCGQMLPVWMIMEKNLNIVVDAEKNSY
jgi:intein/homing endonuclease